MDYKAIIASYGNKIIRSGSEEYVPIGLSEAFLDDLCSNNLVVIGVEIFEIENNKIKPHIDLIADWSTLLKTAPSDLVDRCKKLSKDFLNGVPRGSAIYANFCCLTAEEVEAAGHS